MERYDGPDSGDTCPATTIEVAAGPLPAPLLHGTMRVMPLPVSYDDILAARDRLRPFFETSPVRHYPLLDGLVGHGIRVLVKHENHLPTGSFKVRNGTASITALTSEQAERGVIAATTVSS